MTGLEGKTVALGVSGGIAAYKAVELLRLLRGEGAAVYVVMTPQAKQFVTPLTFEALSERPVYHGLFAAADAAAMPHVRTAGQADLLAVVPATANILGKMAHGLADDALSTFFTAYPGPVLAAPAMNSGMWANPAVQANVRLLKERGMTVLEPAQGELACGTFGPGRLPEPEVLLAVIRDLLAAGTDLAGRHFLVTAGPTREPLDPVRFISNPSSGKMGYAVAQRARARGAEVTLISGPTQLDPPAGVTLLPCQRADEMHRLVLENLPVCDVLVMTAAVGDFAPASVHKEKIKKRGAAPLVLELVPTPDILKDAAAHPDRPYLVGFAAETENLEQSALEKWRGKGLDLVLANDISAPGIGFQSDQNQVLLIAGPDSIEPWPRMSKRDIADRLLDRIREGLARNQALS